MAVSLLLICSACLLKTSLSLVVTQSPETVHVTVGDPFTIKCISEKPVTYCYSSTFWHKYNPRTGKLSEVTGSRDKVEDDDKTCTLTIPSTTLQNSGIYYCSFFFYPLAVFGNGTKVIVTDRRPLKPSIVLYSPTDIAGPTVHLQCLVKGVVPSQVRVLWIVDQSERTGLVDSTWTEKDSAEDYTLATITISEEEWTIAHIECVVMYNSTKISKILKRDFVCPILLYAGMGAASLIVAVTTISAFCLPKVSQSTTTVKRNHRKEARGKQNFGSRDTLRPTAVSSSTEVQYSSVNTVSLNYAQNAELYSATFSEHLFLTDSGNRTE